MHQRVAICNFNLADYSRQEGQEGVGLQGGKHRRLGSEEWRRQLFVATVFCCAIEANAKGLVFFVALYSQFNLWIRLQDFENVFVN